MSEWTYCEGYIEVTPFGRTQEEKEFILKTILNHLPIVDGSEEPMYTHVIKAGGYSHRTHVDEFRTRSKRLYIDNCHGYRLVQDRYYVFIEGAFRDRSFSETYRQIIKWLVRLSKRTIVITTDVNVHGGYDDQEERIYCKDSEFADLYDMPSWLEDNSHNWTEKLLPAYYGDL